jgi:uncharacterized protein YndB with AHSA1/START domain
VIDPDALVVEFEVRAPADHAFRVWTRRAELWWPASHTVSGDAESITFGPGVGGRIVERGRDGREHDWGEITDWDEPHRLGFVWVHVFDPSQATHVSVTFEQDGGATHVRLEHTGFAALGAPGMERRARTGTAWSAVSHAFVGYAEAEH